MDETPKHTPAGAPVLDCAHDHECTVLTCDFCLKELPADNAIREEGQDYVAHFCGLECLEAWRKRHEHTRRMGEQ